jgi:hypothetical protein
MHSSGRYCYHVLTALPRVSSLVQFVNVIRGAVSTAIKREAQSGGDDSTASYRSRAFKPTLEIQLPHPGATMDQSRDEQPAHCGVWCVATIER